MARPGWVLEGWKDWWFQPWTVPTSSLRATKFKWALWEHGYLSPHYTRDEARCHDGTGVPLSLRKNAQKQAFMMERVRHRLGDKPIRPLSWYRTPSYNRQIGGASNSQHMYARATDFSLATVQSFGTSRFDSVCNDVYSSGGFGQYPGGSRHTDCRGYRARWTSF